MADDRGIVVDTVDIPDYPKHSSDFSVERLTRNVIDALIAKRLEEERKELLQKLYAYCDCIIPHALN